MKPLLSFPARRPVRATIVALLLAALAVLSVRRLRPDTSLRSFFPYDDPAAAALDRVYANFPVAEELLVLATLPGKDPDPRPLFAFADRLQQRIAGDPEAARLVASFRYRIDAQSRDFIARVVVPAGLFYLNDDEFDAARHRLTRTEMEGQLQRNEAMLAAPGPAAGALAKALLQDPLRLHEFIEDRLAGARPIRTYQNSDAFLSEDGRSLLIRIAGVRPPSDLDFCRQLTIRISQLAAEENREQLQIEFSGAYPIATQSERSIRRDSISSVNGSVICLALLFIVAFRQPLPLFAVTLIPVAMGILYGFGVEAAFQRSFTPLTAVIGAMLAGIGIDYAIFYLVHYQERRGAGDSTSVAAAETIQQIGSPLLAAWVTSVVGFVAIMFASVPALREFAIVGTLGLAGALTGTVFVLPALLALVDKRPSVTAPPFRVPLRPLLEWINRRAGVCIVAGGLGLLSAGLFLLIRGPLPALETDPNVMHPRPNPALDAEAHIAERMGASPDSLIVHLQAKSPEALVILAHRVNERLGSSAARATGVQSTLSLASFLPDPEVARRRLAEVGPALADTVTRDFDAAIADSSFSPQAYRPYRDFLHRLLTPAPAPGVRDLLAYKELAESLLPRTATPDQLPTEAITLVFMGSAMDRMETRQAALQSLRRLLGDIPGAALTGMSVLNVDTQATIQHDLPRLSIAAMVIVAVYLLVHFRSIPLSLFAVVPSLFSLTCLLVIARLVGAKMNLANIVSVPLLIGIDVDYGIFLVSVARRSASRSELLQHVTPSAQAVILCAFSTLLGFGSMAFTSVPAVRSLGWAVVIGVSTCAISSLLFLLPLLLWMKDRSMVKIRVPAGSVLRGALPIVVLGLLLTGCAAPAGRLTFPESPIERTADCDWYDIHQTGHREFGVARDSTGRVDRLLYCASDGTVNREYRLSDYANDSVPHMILLLDSLPFETVRERYDAGDLRWFDPPQKMIAPFPSLTEVCYTAILHAPPLPGMTDSSYDPRTREQQHTLWRRLMGDREPWYQRLDYSLGVIGQGLSFIHPDEWFASELEQARRAVEAAPTRVSIVYISSAASMVCARGRPGAEKVLDGARRLCLQMLYERRGAIKISMMADHGHNYTPSKNFSLAEMLQSAGFRPADRIQRDDDCVVEFSALVTCGGVHTRRPADVAAALCTHEQVEMAIYQQGSRSIIQASRGRAAVECRGGKLRYVPIDADVLGYGPVIERLKAAGLADPDGFASEEIWFSQTVDHPWPDAPRRVWDALHGLFINPPDVMLSIKDGYYSGYPGYENFIRMASTHGGLNQVNSATFVMTMTGRLHEAVQHEAVLSIIEPGAVPRVHP